MSDMNQWGYVEFALFDEMAGGVGPLYEDRYAQALYDSALFNHDISSSDRRVIIEGLREHMRDEYGMNFDDVFDWDSYREAYDNAQV